MLQNAIHLIIAYYVLGVQMKGVDFRLLLLQVNKIYVSLGISLGIEMCLQLSTSPKVTIHTLHNAIYLCALLVA